jgi:hypothetical protein
MKRLDDQKIRDAFSENEEKRIVQGIEKEDLWLRIEQQLPKSRKLNTNWYRSVAAALIFAVLSGWSITLMRYDQIQSVNKQLTTSLEELERLLELQKKQIAERSVGNEKVNYKKEENKAQVPEKRIEEDHLLSENKKLKAERESLISKNVLLHEQLNILSFENNRRGDSLRLISEKINEPQERSLVTIEKPQVSESQVDRKINNAGLQNAKAELHMSDLPDKRKGRRLKIQLFNPGESVENNSANDVRIFKLFK